MAKDVITELQRISRKHGGILRAEDVVEFARNPKTALHGKFTWDDDAAAHQYRLWQAREIIRVSVTVLPKAEVEHRAFVSLVGDRSQPGGGYRTTVDVLSDADLRGQLLAQALKELEYFKAKYRELKELAPVFAAIETVAERKGINRDAA